MSEALIGVNLAIAAAGLTICIIGLLQSLLGRQLAPETRRFLVVIFAVLVVYVGCDLLGQAADDYSGTLAVAAARVLLFLESLSSAFAALVLLAFLLRSCGEERWWESAAFRAACVLWLLYLAMLVFNEATGAFYVINRDNVYHRGPYYPALLVPPVLIMAIGLAVLVKRRADLSPGERSAFVAYLVIPAASMVWQMLSYGLYIVVLGTAIAAFVMLTYIQSDQSRRHYLAQAENARLKSDLMLSQLQPHFLSNALGAIGGLCRDNPEAKEAIGTFSRYLRENVDALTDDAPAPFSRELDHARAYLELEKLRFGDDLSVAYDVRATEFFMPTLTLQPIAENAVRHGIRGTEDGTGTVTVSSRECKDRWEVTVADDGAGFDPMAPPADGRTHVGLAAVRERLHHECGGELLVESEPGCGSRVTIVIPKAGEPDG
ncbi:MAG: histidine kinase [Eggerthellaceae bacterium]|nr:histidine kinase [Eggerthellaceae bacterium]